MNETALEYFQRANLEGKSAEQIAKEFEAIQRFKQEEIERLNLAEGSVSGSFSNASPTKHEREVIAELPHELNSGEEEIGKEVLEDVAAPGDKEETPN